MYLNPLLKELIEAAKNEDNLEGLREIHPDFYQQLVELGFFVKQSDNEIEKVRQRIDEVNYNEEEYYLIINSTMNCNFGCWYCYETHKKNSHISDASLQKIKKFIENTLEKNKKITKYTIQFFGGEPLLDYKKSVLPIMDYAFKKAQQRGIILLLNFTTNGYLISDDMIQDFLKYKVNGFQITLDGNRDEHDKVRFVSKTKGSYDKIVENIKKIVRNKMSVVLRINYTEKNLKELDLVFEDLEDLELEYRSLITFSLNKVWQESNNNLGEKVSTFLSLATNKGFSLPDALLSDRVENSCYADKFNQATINYDGNVYKCNARDFTDENKEGILNDEGVVEWNEKRTFRMEHKLKNKACLECRILPICGGGCSQNMIEHVDKDYCVNDFDEAKKDDIILSMFLSENVEKI
ncbi:hypothetical protein AVL50_24770 [Flammeovirga sp. SJP92]|nr:hypothetical protein AVL50_24770 [Flammeovirga sp. SJP92]